MRIDDQITATKCTREILAMLEAGVKARGGTAADLAMVLGLLRGLVAEKEGPRLLEAALLASSLCPRPGVAWRPAFERVE